MGGLTENEGQGEGKVERCYGKGEEGLVSFTF